MGSPYPYPASTAGPSPPSPSAAMSASGERAVEYRYVHMLGSPDRGMPPPSSLTLRVTSSSPSATTRRTGGGSASDSSKRSVTARSEFLTSSNSMWCRWDGTYANVKAGSPYTSTAGADPYSRAHIARASSIASRATRTGEHRVQTSPM